ncbi:MAG TPA: hypothetical protein PLU22_03050 [Polyangiaceae bacterium]|nr:hypothetical protein [Polyangiaceae bacterium]
MTQRACPFSLAVTMAKARSAAGLLALSLSLAGAGGIAVSGCRPSLAPHVEEGTVSVGVVYKEELHASRGAYTRLSFGNPPPHLQVRVEETQIGSFGPFALAFDQEGRVQGTVTLGERTLDVVDASPLQKEGRVSTMVLTVAQQGATSRVVPAELVAVGWPDRGRWSRKFGKRLARAGTRDRLDDVAALKAEFRAAMARELAAATLVETPSGFTVVHGERDTTVDLQRMVAITVQGQARAVIGRLAVLARHKLERPIEPAAEGVPSTRGRAGDVFCLLVPEGPFSMLSRSERDALVTRPAAPGLIGVYILDFPDHFELLKRTDVPSLGVPPAALEALSAKNLLESIGPIYRIDVGSGVFLISSVGFFDSSLLMVPEVWSEVDPLLAGDRVVAVPERDTLMVTGANNSKGMEVLLAAARAAGDSENPLAAHLLIWRSGRYERSQAR